MSAEIYFERVAVVEEQISIMKLPTRPTKATDSRSKRFEGESVEVDAIAASILRAICHSCIVQHIDNEALTKLLMVEDQEKSMLDDILQRMEGAA